MTFWLAVQSSWRYDQSGRRSVGHFSLFPLYPMIFCCLPSSAAAFSTAVSASGLGIIRNLRLTDCHEGTRDQPIPCTSLDGTTEAKYFLQFKGGWFDKTVKGQFLNCLQLLYNISIRPNTFELQKIFSLDSAI